MEGRYWNGAGMPRAGMDSGGLYSSFIEGKRCPFPGIGVLILCLLQITGADSAWAGLLDSAQEIK